MAMRVVGNVRPRVEAPPPPAEGPVGDLDRQIEQTRQALARETDPAQAEVLIQRLDLYQRRRQALILTEQNAAAASRAAAAAAVQRIGREQRRKARGMTLVQVEQRVQQLTAQHNRLVQEVDQLQSEVDAVAAQGTLERPDLPSGLLWETPQGAIWRARREVLDRQRYALECELTELRPLLEPEAPTTADPGSPPEAQA